MPAASVSGLPEKALLSFDEVMNMKPITILPGHAEPLTMWQGGIVAGGSREEAPRLCGHGTVDPADFNYPFIAGKT